MRWRHQRVRSQRLGTVVDAGAVSGSQRFRRVTTHDNLVPASLPRECRGLATSRTSGIITTGRLLGRGGGGRCGRWKEVCVAPSLTIRNLAGSVVNDAIGARRARERDSTSDFAQVAGLACDCCSSRWL
jgi:hypothetical protein